MGALAYKQSEIDYLEEKWGVLPVRTIAKNLNRSEEGIKVKAYRNKLGSAYTSEYLNANQISLIFHIDRHVITDAWKEKHNLPIMKKTMKKNYQWLISIDNLLKWCEKYQNLWDSRKVEQFALGSEPQWLKDKRQKDSSLPKKRFQKWTAEEDRKAINLFKSGHMYKDIAIHLQRSTDSVSRRLARLDIWGTGEFIGSSKDCKRNRNYGS